MSTSNLISNIKNDIFKSFENQHGKLKIIGSEKQKISFKIIDSYRFQSDEDISLTIPYLKDNEINIEDFYAEQLEKLYSIISKYKSKLYLIKKYPGMVRIKYNNKIYDFSLSLLKDRKLWVIDNMFGTLKESEVVEIENSLKLHLKKKYLKEIIVFFKTLVGLYKIYKYRLPKGSFLTFLIIHNYKLENSLEKSIHSTLKNLKNFLNKHKNHNKILLAGIEFKVKFKESEILAFIKVLDQFLKQGKFTKIYEKENTQKIVFIGGMSESGKSTAGIFLEKNLNYKRIKIINIEKELLKDFGIRNLNVSKDKFSDLLKYLYSQKNIYALFLHKIYDYSIGQNVVLESLYRSKLFLEIQKLHPKTYCFYLEATKTNRINREFLKVTTQENIDFNQHCINFEQKEKFKRTHKAHMVKNVATHLINNNGTLEKLLLKIKDLESKL